MTMYYVATLASYVLVDADSDDEARTVGRAAIAQLRAASRPPRGHDMPITVHTVRPATVDEIELWNWHQEKLSEENQR